MIFTPTALAGAYLVELEWREDARGAFARSWCREEFGDRGLVTDFPQANVAVSRAAGTLRGLHYQAEPHGEAKLVRVTRGSIHDVIVDLRPDSPTYRRSMGVELSAGDGRMLYVPEMFAHGYLTLEDDTETVYQVSHAYTPQAERGIRYDDPALGIRWPLAPRAISEKDLSWPVLEAPLPQPTT